ncbi:hypothetical protein B0H19DRAFT_1257430 [Mycena capillaripes]|nr:hypothetical protein B0H19DRAFT_1257430 [Mycena capillaripes]
MALTLPYESYSEDPKLQTRFTAMWCAVLGLAVLPVAPRALALPAIRERPRTRGVQGVETEGCDGKEMKRKEGSALETMGRVLDSVQLRSLPGIPLNVGQTGYAVLALLCIVLKVSADGESELG